MQKDKVPFACADNVKGPLAFKCVIDKCNSFTRKLCELYLKHRSLKR